MIQGTLPTDGGFSMLELVVLVEFIIIAGMAVQMFRLSSRVGDADCCKKAKAWSKAQDKWIEAWDDYFKNKFLKTIAQMQTVICQHRKYHAGVISSVPPDIPLWCDADPIGPPPPPCTWGNCPEED